MSKRTFWILTVVLLSFVVAGIDAQGPRDSDRSEKPRPRGHWGGWTRLSEEQEEELLGALKEKMPDYYAHLISLRDEHSTMYRSAIRRSWWRYQSWKDLPPEVQQAAITEQTEKMEIVRILKALRDTDDPQEKTRIKGLLSESVSRWFDAEQIRQQHRLLELKQRIRQLEEELKQNTENKEVIVERRVKRLLETGFAEMMRSEATTRRVGHKRPERRE